MSMLYLCAIIFNCTIVQLSLAKGAVQCHHRESQVLPTWPWCLFFATTIRVVYNTQAPSHKFLYINLLIFPKNLHVTVGNINEMIKCNVLSFLFTDQHTKYTIQHIALCRLLASSRDNKIQCTMYKVNDTIYSIVSPSSQQLEDELAPRHL